MREDVNKTLTLLQHFQELAHRTNWLILAAATLSWVCWLKRQGTRDWLKGSRVVATPLSRKVTVVLCFLKENSYVFLKYVNVSTS